jgi:uncharacterized SAM-binding protein YcdF (DUF218 family)
MRPLALAMKLTAGLVALALLYLCITAFQVWLASRQDESRPADAIVVLGAAQYQGRPSGALAVRLDHALELYEAGIAEIVVVTGGRREGDRFTEAAASAGYLLARGVPESALRLESGGSNSFEQLAAVARFLRREDIADVVLVSEPYHAMRIDAIAGEVGLNAHVSPAGHGGGIARLGRETVAVAVGRIIGYRRLVNLDDSVGHVRTGSGSR